MRSSSLNRIVTLADLAAGSKLAGVADTVLNRNQSPMPPELARVANREILRSPCHDEAPRARNPVRLPSLYTMPPAIIDPEIFGSSPVASPRTPRRLPSIVHVAPPNVGGSDELFQGQPEVSPQQWSSQSSPGMRPRLLKPLKYRDSLQPHTSFSSAASGLVRF